MNSFSDYVRRFAQLVEDGRSVPLPGDAEPAQPASSADNSPVVLIFSPHPDDEIIMGALPLRLLRRASWRVVNVAVTQGSNRARQAERWEELSACCQRIGFELLATQPGGLEHINEQAARGAGPAWLQAVAMIRGILEQYQPRLVLFPHAADWNSTHIGVNLLLQQALGEAGLSVSPWICETEFWGQMTAPNLLVESSVEELSDLVTALAAHVGEVRRNPYHLSLPAWMMENVRRAELVVGQGRAVPPMQFGTMYRLGRWLNGRVASASEGRTLLHAEDPATLFPT